MLAKDRGREGAARRARPRVGAPRAGRECGAHPGGSAVIVDSLTFAEDGLIAALDTAAIDRAIVCPPRARGHGYDVENERVAALVGAHPDRLVGFARIDPLAPGAGAELEH